MKAPISTITRFAALAVACILFAGIAANVRAGGDGKGAVRLLELSRRAQLAPAPVVSEPTAMSCPKCKDVLVSKPDVTSRGLGARTLAAGGVPTQTVASHLCSGCGVQWKISGHGKAKEAVASHKCTASGTDNLVCCKNIATR